MSTHSITFLDYQSYKLLKDGPTIQGLFGDEGKSWSKLKQNEPIRIYSSPKKETQKISDRVGKDVEDALCWAMEIAIQEKVRRKN